MTQSKQKSVCIGLGVSLGVLLVLYATAVVSLACARRVKRRYLLSVLRETATCLNAHNIPYVVFWGTLLGAHREQGIIADDDDVDFVIFGKHNADKAMALLEAAHGKRRFKPGERKFFAANTGAFTSIHADLQYAEQDGPTGPWVRKDVMSHIGVMPADAPVHREAVAMHGVTVYKPPNTHEILVELYGDDYITPIAYKKTEGDPRHDFNALAIRAAAKKVGLYI